MATSRFVTLIPEADAIHDVQLSCPAGSEDAASRALEFLEPEATE